MKRARWIVLLLTLCCAASLSVLGCDEGTTDDSATVTTTTVTTGNGGTTTTIESVPSSTAATKSSSSTAVTKAPSTTTTEAPSTAAETLVGKWVDEEDVAQIEFTAAGKVVFTDLLEPGQMGYGQERSDANIIIALLIGGNCEYTLSDGRIDFIIDADSLASSDYFELAGREFVGFYPAGDDGLWLALPDEDEPGGTRGEGITFTRDS